VIVAIDGPAGAGKSSLARDVAEILGFGCLHSGAMYRAFAVWLDRHSGSVDPRAHDVEIVLGDRILVDGDDVTDEILSPHVAQITARLAADPRVRSGLIEKQREILSGGDWVAEGRDIGTVVVPDADLKIFLTASAEARARRRAAETGEDWRAVLSDIERRDEQDVNRVHSPLRPALDAIELDSTDRSLVDVVAQVVSLVRTSRVA
jgi:cytidylate kinase